MKPDVEGVHTNEGLIERELGCGFAFGQLRSQRPERRAHGVRGVSAGRAIPLQFFAAELTP